MVCVDGPSVTFARYIAISDTRYLITGVASTELQ